MPESIDTRNHPTVKALIAHQQRLEETDVVFARRYINCSAASWSLLKTGQYTADPSKMLERCEAGLQVLNDQAERDETTEEACGKLVDLPHVKATLNAIQRCYGAPQNRLVVYLAPTGGGKTSILRRIAEKYKGAAITIEATEPWRSSYFYGLTQVAEAIGLDPRTIDPTQLENKVLDDLKRTPRILCLDEGHYLGPATANLLKVILNKTDSRIALIAIPELWERMTKKAFKEAEQLRRRTVAKIVVKEVTHDDCRRVLSMKLPGYDELTKEIDKEVVQHVVQAANRFGLFDTIDRVCSEIRSEMESKKIDLSADVVDAAIKRAEALRS